MITNEKLSTKDVNQKLKEPMEMYIDALVDEDNEENLTTYDPEGKFIA
jgi:hypothetical protein